MRERSTIVDERIVVLPEAPMTPANVPPSSDEPSVSEEWRSMGHLISMPPLPPPPPRPLGMEHDASATLPPTCGCC
jgi:hypothetical protein